jgi:glyoxylase-like metal-dependent hydrolase (beta-lactamase superfamily II)
MSTLKWTIGDVEIFQIIEIEAGKIIQDVLKDATPENIRQIPWLCPQFADEAGHLKALVQSFLIKSDHKNILIDTCIGNDKPRTNILAWANLRTDFLRTFSDIGVPETDVDVVACTHLHIDHAGWNTKLEGGVWVPTFPNAKYLFAREEYEYWLNKPENELADHKATFDDSVSPIMNAGLAELVDVDHKIDGHVSFIPTPGHTPAHVCVLVESQNQRAIISGDLLHHPCQIANPQWATATDTSSDKATLARQRILEQIADTETLLIGSHFADPVIGRVVRVKDRLIFKV